jgi:hypothetical protein
VEEMEFPTVPMILEKCVMSHGEVKIKNAAETNSFMTQNLLVY